jgi:hypothetical protein
MNMLKRIRKAIASSATGCLATATSRDIPEAGVKVERKSSLKDRFTRTTPCCSYCLMEFKGHMGGVKAVPADQYALIQHHVQHCPSNPLVQRLEAATDAFRKIECKTNGRMNLLTTEIRSIHATAQIGWRAATK